MQFARTLVRAIQERGGCSSDDQGISFLVTSVEINADDGECSYVLWETL